jgi:hypothetical protein
MAATNIQLVVDDTAPALVATLANANGPQDLTGASVVARLKSSIPGDPILQIAMTIDADPTTGKVSHVWATNETNRVLKYTVEFVVTFAGGGIETFPVLPGDVPSIVIRERKTA